MKKVAKKNLKLDKEVIASLSENEMVKVTGGDIPPFTKGGPDCPVPVPLISQHKDDRRCHEIYRVTSPVVCPNHTKVMACLPTAQPTFAENTCGCNHISDDGECTGNLLND